MGKRSIYLKSAEEAEIIRANGDILGKTHAEVAKILDEGVTTARLDEVAEQFIRDNGGVPSFKGYGGFPASLCISVNEVVVHGFPSDRVLKSGDIISIDCGVYKNGFHADSAYTYMIGEVDDSVKELLRTTKESLYEGINQVKPGNRIGDLSFAIQSYNERNGYGIVRELVGHGVGKHLHEAPEVPNFGKRGNGPRMKKGMVIAIEPMVTLGKRFVLQEEDGWTIRTEDRSAAAHYEHTVMVTENGYDILTTFEYIEKVLEEKKMFFV
ncbi:type I methionyl aminopeptidase [Jiulongibacter sediminis]|uniref:Methionine aminopeptidase n=1 Tax=Jiulongibacter sediminis TaxID=1605367 RepID=A0A0P7C6D9_9BACT|nr:type I methionyl aminopeptidase [Jiulongibacter sediminis]KPM49867.1 methionine aminopeptidase [Jiulongibacter sediminis]TBX26903.1 methionine aminopeptidase [Jiulongibacter sediminis]